MKAARTSASKKADPLNPPIGGGEGERMSGERLTFNGEQLLFAMLTQDGTTQCDAIVLLYTLRKEGGGGSTVSTVYSLFSPSYSPTQSYQADGV